MDVDFVLRNEDIYRFNIILTKIVDKARTNYIFLINKSGRLITSQSEESMIDRSAFAALVAGSFSSTTCIANLIGENEFNSLYHQGRKKNIYISQVDDNTVITLVFDKRTKLEKVKNVLNEHLPELQQALKACYQDIESNPDINLDVLSEEEKQPAKQPLEEENGDDNDMVDMESFLQ